MKKRLLWCITASLVLLTSASSLVLAKSEVADKGGYTEADQEFYLSTEALAFIRPGLDLEIMDVVIPSDLMTEVTFKITDPAGLPLDREGIFTPGAVSTSFILAHIPEGEEAYVAYTTRIATSPDTGDSAIQASTDSGGSYTNLEPGVYLYKFGTLVPDNYDTNATHTLGIYARRDLLEFDLDRYVDNETEDFIPSGSGVAMSRDIVTTETCNRCHDPLAIHGGARTDVPLCVLCHNPTQSIDPDTGDSVDMPYMVHKIHAGVELENGYTIIGYRQSVHDYSEVVFPTEDGVLDCAVCHTGGIPTDEYPLVANPNPSPVCDGSGLSTTTVSWGDEGAVNILVGEAEQNLFGSTSGSGSSKSGKWNRDGLMWFLQDATTDEVIQELPVYNTVNGCVTNPAGTFRGVASVDHTNWMTRTSRWVCGSCHDDIDFAEGVNHIKQDTDDSCGICHDANSGVEFDLSVAGAHTVPYKSHQLGGVIVEWIDVQDTGPGEFPLVTLSIRNKFGRLNPAELGRLRMYLAGPNEGWGDYERESADLSALVPNGDNWDYRFVDVSIPADATGSYSLIAESRINEAPLVQGDGTVEYERDLAENYFFPIAVTDAVAEGRRMIVDDAKCENCHANLAFHGGNRHNGGEFCQVCHNPNLVTRDGEESASFKYMIHKIHRGEDLEFGYSVGGDDFSHVIFPGDLRNCESCHDDGTYNLPVAAGALPTPSPATPIDPMMPETASCLSCHDSTSAAVHADLNSNNFGEACATCHGETSTFSVDRVHAR